MQEGQFGDVVRQNLKSSGFLGPPGVSRPVSELSCSYPNRNLPEDDEFSTVFKVLLNASKDNLKQFPESVWSNATLIKQVIPKVNLKGTTVICKLFCHLTA